MLKITSRPDLFILSNLIAACDADVLRENLAGDGVVDLTSSMLQARLDQMLAQVNECIEQPDGELIEELEVIGTLLEFHWGSDEPGEGHYDEEAFKRLCKKFGVGPSDYMQPEPDWDPSQDTAEEYDASFEE